jgi:hypothetical protein
MTNPRALEPVRSPQPPRHPAAPRAGAGRTDGGAVVSRIVQLTDDQRLLCPLGVTLPLHPAHEQRTRLLDAVYEATPKDDDGEMQGTAAAAYDAAAYRSSLTSERMHLYEHTASPQRMPGAAYVVAWFWRCPTCGFVLPAQQVTR